MYPYCVPSSSLSAQYSAPIRLYRVLEELQPTYLSHLYANYTLLHRLLFVAVTIIANIRAYVNYRDYGRSYVPRQKRLRMAQPSDIGQETRPRQGFTLVVVAKNP